MLVHTTLGKSRRLYTPFSRVATMLFAGPPALA